MSNKETCDMKTKILKLIINHVEQLQQETPGIYCEETNVQSYEIVGGVGQKCPRRHNPSTLETCLQHFNIRDSRHSTTFC